MTTTVYLWLGFGLFVLTMMVLDLGVFHRKAHTIRMREAAAWTAVWVSLALVFNGVIYVWLGPVRAVEFLTGYVIEKNLVLRIASGVVCCALVAAVAASLVVARVGKTRAAKATTHKAEPVEVLEVH